MPGGIVLADAGYDSGFGDGLREVGALAPEALARGANRAYPAALPITRRSARRRWPVAFNHAPAAQGKTRKSIDDSWDTVRREPAASGPQALPDPVPGLFYPGQTLDSAPPSTSRILPVTQPDAGVAR